MAKEPDYRSMDELHLKYALKKLEKKILSITGDPLGNYHKFFEWAKNGPAMEKVQELMSTRGYILHLLFEKHCTPAEVARLEEVNALLLDLTNRTYKRTANFARTMLSIPGEPLDDDLTIEGKLVPEFDLPSSVLRLEDDSYYGSDFVRMAAILQETEEYQPGMADVRCYPSQLSVPFTPSITDEQLNCANDFDDGTTWAEAWLRIPPLEHIVICYAFHALVTHMNWSIPDVLRINDYKIEVTATVQQFSDQARNRLWWWDKYSLQDFKHALLAECQSRPEGLPLETYLLQRCRDYFEERADEALLGADYIADIDSYLGNLYRILHRGSIETVKEVISRTDFDALVPILQKIVYKPKKSIPVLREWYDTLRSLEPSDVRGRKCHAQWCDDNLVPGQPREYIYVTGVEGDFWRDILASNFTWDPQTNELEALAWLVKSLSPDSEPYGSVTDKAE